MRFSYFLKPKPLRFIAAGRTATGGLPYFCRFFSHICGGYAFPLCLLFSIFFFFSLPFLPAYLDPSPTVPQNPEIHCATLDSNYLKNASFPSPALIIISQLFHATVIISSSQKQQWDLNAPLRLPNSFKYPPNSIKKE